MRGRTSRGWISYGEQFGVRAFHTSLSEVRVFRRDKIRVSATFPIWLHADIAPRISSAWQRFTAGASSMKSKQQFSTTHFFICPDCTAILEQTHAFVRASSSPPPTSGAVQRREQPVTRYTGCRQLQGHAERTGFCRWFALGSGDLQKRGI